MNGIFSCPVRVCTANIVSIALMSLGINKKRRKELNEKWIVIKQAHRGTHTLALNHKNNTKNR